MSIKFFLIQGLEKLIKKNFLFFLKLQVQFISCKKNKKPLSVNSIAVVNTFDTHGGAAKIAYELTSRLRVDYDVQLFVKYKNSNANWINKLAELNYSFIEEVLRRESIESGWIELTGFQGKQLLKDSFFVQTSVVHLHNLHGEFFSPALFKVLFRRKKVIWTLHDESFITGHCSCTFNCIRWKNGCGDCPDLSIYPPVKYDNTKKVLAQKKKWILDIQPIVVCPSKWLANRVKIAYPSLKKIMVIPNGINTEIFKPISKEEARGILGLPLNKKIVLFVAEFSTNNPFKGGAIIRNLIADSTFTELVFITVGGDNTSGYMNHITYPYINKDTDLSLLYAASDVLLYPTQADNLPLVVLESMSCGTPVIASSLGGIPEIIRHNENGMLVEDFKKESAFKDALHAYLSLDEENLNRLKLNARETICSDFELLQMVDRYKTIYNS